MAVNNTINSDLIRGHIDTIILKALYEGDRYGFDIIKEVEQKTDGEYVIKQPTLYSSLKRLEEQGFIKSYWGTKSVGGRRKYFTLTELGKDLFIKNQTDWERSREIIDKLVSNNDYVSAGAALSEKTPAERNAEEIAATEQTETITEAITEDVEDSAVFLEPPVEEPAPPIEEQAVFLEPPPVEEVVEPIKEEQLLTSQENEQPTYRETTDSNSVFLSQDDTYSPEDAYAQTASYSKPATNEIIDAEASYVENLSNDDYVPTPAPYVPPRFDSSFIDDEKPFAELVEEEHEAETPIEDDGVFISNEVTSSSGGETSSSSASTQFLKYDDTAVSYVESEISDEEIIRNEYRSVLARIIPPPKPDLPEEEEFEQETVRPDKEEQKAKLERIIASAEEMGDKVDIKPYDNTLKKYNSDNYFYSNKVMLIRYGALFLIMLAEIAISFCINELIIKSGLPIARSDMYIYIASVVVALLFPIFAFISGMNNLYKRKKLDMQFRSSLIIRSIVTAQLIVIVFMINVFNGILSGVFTDYLASFIMPSLLCTNVLVSGLINMGLIKSKKYNVEG